MDILVAQALVRFGLGRRNAERVPSDPAEWLRGQLAQPAAGSDSARPSTVNGLSALRQDRADKPPPGEGRASALYRAEAAAAVENALTTATPFRERLVWFWTNHFTVSIRGGVAAVAGAFVEEAIRPHVTGRFDDMLFAVMRHPAMLMYLNNAGSVGPGSPSGQRSQRGLNENLARECLELHTVSPAADYSQTDVTNFAKLLTGWSIDLRADQPGFRFRPMAHEPGTQLLMDREFPDGEAGGVAALHFLAAHPLTQRFLATKLVRHFVADDPPADAVRRVEDVLLETRGDLGAAADALVSLDAAWQPASKLRTPMDFVVATMRMLDLPPEQRQGMNLPRIVGSLGQPMWNAPQPNGWPDRASDWTTPEAIMRRIDWAYSVSGRVSADSGQDTAELAEATLGPLLGDDTLQAVHRAGSRRDAITLLLTSPEFQRR